jgi:hypothetical protein
MGLANNLQENWSLYPSVASQALHFDQNALNKGFEMQNLKLSNFEMQLPKLTYIEKDLVVEKKSIENLILECSFQIVFFLFTFFVFMKLQSEIA